MKKLLFVLMLIPSLAYGQAANQLATSILQGLNQGIQPGLAQAVPGYQPYDYQEKALREAQIHLLDEQQRYLAAARYQEALRVQAIQNKQFIQMMNRK